MKRNCHKVPGVFDAHWRLVGVVLAAAISPACQAPSTNPEIDNLVRTVVMPATAVPKASAPSTALSLTPRASDIPQTPVYPPTYDSSAPNLELASHYSFDGSHFALSPDDSVIAVGYPSAISLFDATTGKLLTEYAKPGAGLMSGGAVAFSPDGKWLAAGVNVDRLEGVGTDIQIWNLSTNAISATYPFDGSAIDVQFSADGRFIAASDPGKGVLELWDIQSDVVQRFETSARKIAFSPTKPLLGTAQNVGSRGGPAIILWDPNAHTSVGLFDLAASPNTLTAGEATSVGFSHDGTRLVAVINGHLRFWNLETNAEEASQVESNGRLVQATFSSRGYLATLDQAGEITVYEPDSGSRVGIASIDFPTGADASTEGYNILFSSSGAHLIAGGSGTNLLAWKVPN